MKGFHKHMKRRHCFCYANDQNNKNNYYILYVQIFRFRSWEFPFDTFVILFVISLLSLGIRKTLKPLWYRKKAYYISIRYMKLLGVNKKKYSK